MMCRCAVCSIQRLTINNKAQSSGKMHSKNLDLQAAKANHVTAHAMGRPMHHIDPTTANCHTLHNPENASLKSSPPTDWWYNTTICHKAPLLASPSTHMEKNITVPISGMVWGRRTCNTGMALKACQQPLHRSKVDRPARLQWDQAGTMPQVNSLP